MALKVSGFGGTNALHELRGCSCDLCGKEADSETVEVVAVDCSFKSCPVESCMYHQACLEKYLKSIKCERNRKIGFPCPRGCGKATKYASPCHGKILKSHPISIRGEANKKRRQAELELLQRNDSKEKDAVKSQSKEGAAPGPNETSISPEEKPQRLTQALIGKPSSARSLNLATPKRISTPNAGSAPKKLSAAAVKKEQLAAAARNLKNEIAARTGSGRGAALLGSAAFSSSLPLPNKAKQVKTLDEYLAERSASSSTLERAMSGASGMSGCAPPGGNAWATKSRASSASSLATESAHGGDLPPLDADTFPPPTSLSPVAPLASRPPIPLPRSTSTASTPPSSSCSTHAAVPAPAKPAPPRGAWAHKQPAVMSIVPPPPPPPRGTASSGALSPRSSGAAEAAQQPEELEHLPKEPSQSKLNKSQRKNQRRAEKKAAEAAGDRAPSSRQGKPGMPRQARVITVPAHPSPRPPPDSPAASATPMSPYSRPPPAPQPHTIDSAAPPPPPPPRLRTSMPAQSSPTEGCLLAPSGADLLDRCLQLVVQNKLQKQVEMLVTLGFQPGMVTAAVQQHGCNLEASLTWLLEQVTGVCDPMHGLTLVGSEAGLVEVDLSEEVAHMQALQCGYSLPPGVLESTVMDCHGDLEAAARIMLEQRGQPASSSQALPAGSQQARAAGRSHPFNTSSPRTMGTTQHAPPLGQPANSMSGAGMWEGAFSAVSHPSPFSVLAPQAGCGPHQGVGLAGDDSGGGGISSSSRCGTYSAFDFGGFTEAALHAVCGAQFGCSARFEASGGCCKLAPSLISSLDIAGPGAEAPWHSHPGSLPCPSQAAGLEGLWLDIQLPPASGPLHGAAHGLLADVCQPVSPFNTGHLYSGASHASTQLPNERDALLGNLQAGGGLSI